MNAKPLTLTTPPAFQCYDCQGCGECCRGRFAIIISHADRNRIVEQGWTAEELGLGNTPLFTPQGDGFLLAHREDGACAFLTDEGRCRIHARFGEPAKPLPCRLYPFRLVPLGSQVRVDVRFDCPATAENFGRAIPGYRSTLLGMMTHVVPERAAMLAPPPFYGNVKATWAQLCRITETFERLLCLDRLDLTRRVVCGITFAALLRSPRIVTLEGRKLSEFLESVTEKVVDGIANAPLTRVAPPGMVRIGFRQLLGVYGRIDQVGEHVSPLARLTDSLRVLRGSGTVPAFRPNFPQVRFDDVEMMTGAPSPVAAAILERYLHLRLTSMSFFGRTFYDRPYLDGINALFLTYPLMNWFARAYAVGNGHETPDAADTAIALQIVDHQHGITPIFNIPTERARQNLLTERSNLRALVIWYGA